MNEQNRSATGNDLTMVAILLAEPPPPAPDVVASARAALDQATRPRVRRLHQPGRPHQPYRLVATAAAVLVLAGGAAYGLTASLGGSTPAATATGPHTATLDAVRGCFPLVTTVGDLIKKQGSTLIVKAQSGRQVTVHTSPGTTINVSEAPASSITDGQSVIVSGHEAHGTIAAGGISVDSSAPGFGFLQAAGKVIVQGKVTGASAHGFTLVTSTGRRIPVTMSIRTQINIGHASFGMLRPGMDVLGIGHRGPGGSLEGSVVDQLSLVPAQGHWEAIKPRNCSLTDIGLAFIYNRTR